MRLHLSFSNPLIEHVICKELDTKTKREHLETPDMAQLSNRKIF